MAADHWATHSSQYEHMLVEYSEYVEAARHKLPTEPLITVSSVDDLRSQLSSHNVSEYDIPLESFISVVSLSWHQQRQ